MTTETMDPKTKSEFEELKARLADVNDKLDESDSIMKSGQRFGGGGDGIRGTHAYWENTEENYRFQLDPSVPAKFKAYRGTLHKDYMPSDHREGSGFKSLGEFIRAGMKDQPTNSKFKSFKEQHAASFSKVKTIQGMSTQVAEDGGYLVYPEYSSGILEHIYRNDIFGRTDNYSIVGNQLTFLRNAETSRKTGSRHGGLRGYWVGEGNQINASKPRTREVTCRLKKLAVMVYLTNELIDDAGPAAEQYVTRKAAEEFNFMLGDSIFNGSGVGQPLGIMNSGALLVMLAEAGQLANTITTPNIDKMWARRLGPLVDGNGQYAWYHNQDVCPQLDALAGDFGTTGGWPFYRTDNQVVKDAPQSLKGAPRYITEFQKTLGDQGDLVLADLGQVLSISKGGVSQEASIHVEFDTDQTAIRFIMRVDAKPWEDTPIDPANGSNTQSSFITLQERA